MWRNPVSFLKQAYASVAADRKTADDKITRWRFAQTNDWELSQRDAQNDAVREAERLCRSDPRAGLQQLLTLAKLGSIRSMIFVGRGYQTGDGLGADPVQAEHWYRLAIEGGSQQAQLRLGRIYADRREFSKCEEVYRIGVAEHWGPAMYYLATVILRQPKTSVRLEEARSLLEQASALGDLGALGALAGSSARGRFGLHRIPCGFWLLCVASMKFIALADEVVPELKHQTARPSASPGSAPNSIST